MGALAMFTVSESPADYPGRFVVRRCAVTSIGVVMDHEPLAVVATLSEARAAIPGRDWLVCMIRNAGDEPQIVETWI